jgi:hypothetical protein
VEGLTNRQWVLIQLDLIGIASSAFEVEGRFGERVGISRSLLPYNVGLGHHVRGKA